MRTGQVVGLPPGALPRYASDRHKCTRCSAGAVGDVGHFLLECSVGATERALWRSAATRDILGSRAAAELWSMPMDAQACVLLGGRVDVTVRDLWPLGVARTRTLARALTPSRQRREPQLRHERLTALTALLAARLLPRAA